MRVSIQPQIDEYKNNNCIKVCELCGEHDRIEIDHHSEKMPFAKLIQYTNIKISLNYTPIKITRPKKISNIAI